ncbi:hypothetical protein DFQ01_11414 [Paenibacillus cellulosilyticus]|uniref:Uncharacterized protein n=1 Tax=Paenibacillus cellulosilyticus TaxID=375489 RepID=A0A2V2YT75_9BACL|nr:hypothetical protein [Paenibacillus cellulosilyticus]PWV99439.1 hypothetical protein DFQ01_11414 [Paenibacillus cellulosilyticus]QKS44697.1 hypothetical protein HUB94_09965 [Paenibacillus cellulosilyticus]
MEKRVVTKTLLYFLGMERRGYTILVVVAIIRFVSAIFAVIFENDFGIECGNRNRMTRTALLGDWRARQIHLLGECTA